MYEQIKTEEKYKMLLNSGMFWEFHPELTGDWGRDKLVINPSQKEEIAPKEGQKNED